jgi:hypothetical protein
MTLIQNTYVKGDKILTIASATTKLLGKGT